MASSIKDKLLKSFQSITRPRITSPLAPTMPKIVDYAKTAGRYGGALLNQVRQDFPQMAQSVGRLSPPGQLYQSFQNVRNNPAPMQNAQRQLGDLYQGAKAIGYVTSPGTALVGGAVNLGFQGVANKFQGKRFFEGGPQSFAQGVSQSAAFGPISRLNPLFRGALGSTPANLTYKTLAQRAGLGAVREGVEGIVTGSIRPLQAGETRRGAIGSDILLGAGMGSVMQPGADIARSIKAVINNNPEVERQLRNKLGQWAKGDTPIKPKGMAKKAWEYQLEFNKKYDRNPYQPVYHHDLARVLGQEAEQRVGFQARPKGGNQAILDAEATNSRKGSYTDPLMGQKTAPSTTVSPQQSQSGLPTRTTANQESSLGPIIDQKGKLNLNRLNVEGESKQVLQGIEKKAQPTVIGNKQVVKAARTAKGASNPMTDAQMEAIMANQVKNRQAVVDLSKKYNQAKAKGASEVELGRIMVEMADQSRVARQGGTFAGRVLQAQNIMADESAGPMQKVLALLDNAGVNQKAYLKDAVKVNWDNPSDVVKFYRKYVPAKLGEVIDEVRYSNMLSSPLTHIVNITSNAIQTGIVAPVEKTITGVLDLGKTALTGKERQYYASAGLDYAGGYVKALPQALKKAWGVLSGKDITLRPDFEHVPTNVSGPMKAYTIPLRALEAMDQFFKTLVKGGVTSELKRGPLKLGMEEIANRASKEADYRLFRQAFDPNGELGQGGILKVWDKWNSGIQQLRRLPGGNWVLPFLQTPTNILKQGVEFSPLGVTTIPGSKRPIEQLSKALVGTGVFLGAMQLGKSGLLSWEAPSGERERELYYAAGLQPYSVKIGDKWVSYSKLGPLAYPVAMAAALANAEKKNPDQGQLENVSTAVGGMLKFFGDQSYVRSIGDLMEAIQDGGDITGRAFTSQAANLAGQLVPFKSFLTWIGRTIDPVYRKANTFGEKMVKDLPVLGAGLEPYTDPSGNPSRKDLSLLNAVSPFKVSQEKPANAPLYREYEQKKIENAVVDREMKSMKAGEVKSFGGRHLYVADDGSAKEINTGKVSSMPARTNYEKLLKEKEAYKLVDNILDNLPADKQDSALKELGVSKDDAVYYNYARQENDAKYELVMERLNASNDPMKDMVEMRKQVNGKEILSSGVIDQLYDEGLISSAQKKYLKALKYNKDSQKVEVDRDYKASGGKKKTISDAQLLSAYKKALEAAYAPRKATKSTSSLNIIQPIKLKRQVVRSLR